MTRCNSHSAGSELGVALGRAARLLVGVAVPVPPAIVVVVVHGEQIFEVEAAWFDPVGRTEMPLDFLERRCPVTVHAPMRPGKA